jgi:hypothetical protein
MCATGGPVDLVVRRGRSFSSFGTQYMAAVEPDNDPRWPVGYPRAAKFEEGISVAEYYRRKHARGEYGRFFPLHIAMTFEIREK